MLSPFSFSSQTSCRWQSLLAIAPQNRPPLPLQTWLLNETSLTARLIALSEGQFDVQIVRQFRGIPTREEQQALAMRRPGLALIREVVLRGHRQPWVFARSVLPLTSLTGRLRRLRKQGNQPLGKFLFKHPQLERSPVVIARFGKGNRYLPEVLQGEQPLWGRRSVFRLDNRPLLVSEVFLDHFTALYQDSDLVSSPDRPSVAK